MNHAVEVIIIATILIAVEPLALHRQVIQLDEEEFVQPEKRLEDLHPKVVMHKAVIAIPIAIVILTAIVQEH